MCNSAVAFRICSRIFLVPSCTDVNAVPSARSSLPRAVHSRITVATPFVNLRSISTTKGPSKVPSNAPSLESQIPTDIQEAKTIVERLSSAQVLAMFEALSAKRTLFTFLVSKAKQAAQIGVIAHAAPTAKAGVQICMAQATNAARDAETMLAEERRKNEKLVHEKASLEREFARVSDATSTHAKPRNLTRGAWYQATKGLSTPEGLQTLSSLSPSSYSFPRSIPSKPHPLSRPRRWMQDEY